MTARKRQTQTDTDRQNRPKIRKMHHRLKNFSCPFPDLFPKLKKSEQLAKRASADTKLTKN